MFSSVTYSKLTSNKQKNVTKTINEEMVNYDNLAVLNIDGKYPFPPRKLYFCTASVLLILVWSHQKWDLTKIISTLQSAKSFVMSRLLGGAAGGIL